MNKKKAISAIILFSLCFAIIAQGSAQTIPQADIGVTEGNTFKYEVKFYWNSTNPSDTVPESLLEQNTTEWIQATIGSVTGTTVTIDEVQHFQDGTETPKQEITNVGTTNQLSILLYAANLNQGDYFLPGSGIPDYYVNSTASRNYEGGARATNYIEIRQNDVDTDGDGTLDYNLKYSSRYFDRQTGILVEAHFSDIYPNYPGQTFSTSYKLVSSNVWNVGTSSGGNNGGDSGGSSTSGFPTEIIYIVIIVIVLAVVVAGLLLIRERRSKPKRKTPAK